jgi:hypothetical protein
MRTGISVHLGVSVMSVKFRKIAALALDSSPSTAILKFVNFDVTIRALFFHLYSILIVDIVVRPFL